MSLKLIPVRNDLPAYSLRVDLNGKIFSLLFRWNERALRWVMDVQNDDGLAIVNGILVLTNIPLLYQYKNENLPEGDFIVLDRFDQGRDPSRDNFGEDVELFYNEV